ncbi:putative bifunctional UDP-N-acetylglucosamine transferase and deubiquitinase ALG13 isoform X1 [Pieris brassicae]|uniref:putative bifunctional UDP-N-acetylglucosamine transferase and deubiquitinase ALG13 isoform X1 n=1 Tax=Pieris brassicae TaxID=7116 RepID=UPI001E65FC54|nr:putative bifunctional UDP-N-acetylglucosamine transferase and deubiquitinase ALG13 isoform X1 [Pieris brassicae]
MSPSPIRCRGPWKIQKRSSEPDRWLDEMDFYRKHTARDSSCLFRAVSENIFNTQHYYQKVRLQCIEFMSSNRHLFEGSLSCSFENYLKEMSNASAWGGIVELSAMSHLYRRDFTILEANKGPQTNICNGYGKTIYLFYSPDTKHFDALYRKEFINNSAFCQSLLMSALIYELLYDRVYHLEDLYYAVDKMLHEKVTNNHIEYMMPDMEHKKQKERAKIFIEETSNAKDNNSNALSLKCKHHTNDIEKASLLKESLSIFVFNRSLIQLENVCLNCLNVNSAKVLLDNGITPFPYKVAKALDPDIYRNIEFDVWSELRRELRFGARYSDGTTLQVGVKCLCKLEVDQDVPYHCHIQEMGQDGGPCLVFIEELGEKRLVNYEQLEPLPMDEIKPWAPPYRYSRANSQLLNLSQMLQQIGSVIRKQGIKSSKKSRNDDTRLPEKETKLDWTEEKAEMTFEAYNYPPYQHSDICNFQPMPVEIETVPLMVDIRAAGAPSQEANGSSPDIHNQVGGAGDMGNQATPTPVSVRASTPATTNSLTTYSGVNPGSVPPLGTTMPGNVPYNCGQYMCGMKSVVWCSPHSPPQPLAPGMPMGGMGINVPHPPPPLPPGVNPHVFKSVQANGSDLPMNDIATLRYFFNLGVECMWAAYGPPLPPPPHPPHPMHPPPRHYSPSTLAQDMQQLAVQDRPLHGDPNHNKHKQDKNTNIQGKGNNAQRPLLGPRFKRGNNQDNNQSHNQNKGHNNQGHMNNKGPNNRRNSYVEARGGFVGEEVGGAEAPLLAFPYAPYPPPIYPVPYYHIDDPGMMGMMGGMGGMGYVYEEGMEFSVQPMYGAPPPYPQMHPAAPPPVHEHK